MSISELLKYTIITYYPRNNLIPYEETFLNSTIYIDPTINNNNKTKENIDKSELWEIYIERKYINNKLFNDIRKLNNNDNLKFPNNVAFVEYVNKEKNIKKIFWNEKYPNTKNLLEKLI